MDTGTRIAKIISYIFHPLLLPTMGLFLIFHLKEAALWQPASEIQLFLYSLTFLATFCLPMLIVMLLLKMKMIGSVEMHTKEERRIPFMAASVFYFAESYFLMNWETPVLVKAMMLGYTLLVVCTLIINVFWKISAHMVGIGGVCGMMIAISYRLQIDIHWTLITLFLLAGLIGFARLKLSAHGPAQVYAGFILGVGAQLVLFL